MLGLFRKLAKDRLIFFVRLTTNHIQQAARTVGSGDLHRRGGDAKVLIAKKNITIVHEKLGHRWDDGGGKALVGTLKKDGDEGSLKTAMMVRAMPSK